MSSEGLGKLTLQCLREQVDAGRWHVGWSPEPITRADLRRLATLAARYRRTVGERDRVMGTIVCEYYFDDLFKRRPSPSGRFRGRLLMLALCQGAALHYVDKLHGVKDFDVWGFFKSLPNLSFPYRGVHGRLDFGPSGSGATLMMKGTRVGVLMFSVERSMFDREKMPLKRYAVGSPMVHAVAAHGTSRSALSSPSVLSRCWAREYGCQRSLLESRVGQRGIKAKGRVRGSAEPLQLGMGSVWP